ncbi:MAG: hypothetical protein HY718_17005 [Planctomycetes bacterium]|nr:hypothetical protein [Planctomycetota bacterium]
MMSSITIRHRSTFITLVVVPGLFPKPNILPATTDPRRDPASAANLRRCTAAPAPQPGVTHTAHDLSSASRN